MDRGMDGGMDRGRDGGMDGGMDEGMDGGMEKMEVQTDGEDGGGAGEDGELDG